MRRLAPAFLILIGGCSLYTDEADPPPGLPISGGTLLVTRDGTLAVAADPERDRVVFIDLAARNVTAAVALQPGDEPGRLVEDGAGRIHVAVRRGGALVTIAGGVVVERRAVCGAPRGLVWQEATDQIHVACATGELVSLPAAGGAATRALRLERDLRDVLVAGDQLVVTRFRAAEILRIDGAGAVIGRGLPAAPVRDTFDSIGNFVQVPATPSVAYRAIAGRNGTVIMVHQRAIRGLLSTLPSGYGGGTCQSGPIEATATVFDPGANTAVPGRAFTTTQLPVDVALAPTGDRIAVVNAGHRTVRLTWLANLTEESSDPCGFGTNDTELTDGNIEGWGAPVAVQFTPSNDLVVQHDRAIVLRDTFGGLVDSIELADPEQEDVGRRRFHTPTFSGLACASCHPEGREDGLVWEFDTLGLRRTQDISGNLAERAPYHWSGDQADLHALVDEVLLSRMGGDPLTADELIALPNFLFSLKAPPVSTSLDPDAVARGKATFESEALGCTTCHNGPTYTNNALVDVGTGGRFKVPSLVGVAWRAPFIHTGCAATLRDRFGTCGGGAAHGATDQLDEAQLADLITFLESL